MQLDINFHLVYIRPFVGHLQLTINKYKGNPDHRDCIMTKYITRIWQFLIKKFRRTWILIHDSLCPCQKSVKIQGIMLPMAYSWDFFTSDLHTSKICWPIFTHTPCNNFISSTENMLVLHKDSFTWLKFHYKYSRLRGTQMFLSTLLQRKNNWFHTVWNVHGTSPKNSKNCKDIHGENLNLIVFK